VNREAAPGYPLYGLLSQKIGRRPTIAVIGCLYLVPASAVYYILVAGAHRDPVTLVGLVALIVVLSFPIWAVHTPYLAESFRIRIRSSGYGISCSSGLYSFYMLGLAMLMPYEFSPIVLLALGGHLISLDALAGPETKDADLHQAALAEVPDMISPATKRTADPPGLCSLCPRKRRP
jgi:hypothetical protein